MKPHSINNLREKNNSEVNYSSDYVTPGTPMFKTVRPMDEFSLDQPSMTLIYLQ
jgi:hypothetical protein